MKVLVLAMACNPARSMPNPLPPEAPMEPSAQQPSASAAFDCSRAPAALGHPDATVQVCAEMQHLPGVFSVMLKGSAGFVSRIVVTDANKHVVNEQGPAVAARFLERHQVAAATALTLQELVFALHAVGGLPPAFTTDAASLEVKDVGKTELALSPTRLVLLRELLTDPEPGKALPQPRYERATLTKGTAGWAWTIEGLTGNGWTPQSQWPLG